MHGKMEIFAEKALQHKIPSQFDKNQYGQPKCNTNSRKTALKFTLQEHIIETKPWKKKGGLLELEEYKLTGQVRETVQDLLAGSKKIAGTEYKRRYDNSLNVVPVKWVIDNVLQPEGIKWYTEN